jgi:hypothetical protein
MESLESKVLKSELQNADFLELDKMLKQLEEKEIRNNLRIKADQSVEISNVSFFRASKNISYFVADLTFEDIAKSLDRISYDQDAQRRLVNGEPYLKDRQVKEFMEVLKKGEDIIGNLVWNLRTEKGKSKDFYFNPLNKTLHISSNKPIYITDGYHRTKACNLLYTEELESNLELAKYSTFKVHIHFLSKHKERDRFGKINHNTNQLSHSKRKRVLDDLRSELVRTLVDKTFLKDKIEYDIDNLSLDKLYTFNQLYNAVFGQKGIFRKYKLDESKNYDDLLIFLINFFNYLPTIRKEFNFANEEDKRLYLKDNLILEPIMLYAYMTVAKEMIRRKCSFELVDEFFKIEMSSYGKNVWFFSRKASFWVGKILYDNGNSISGYPPQTSLIDATVNALKMIKID